MLVSRNFWQISVVITESKCHLCCFDEIFLLTSQVIFTKFLKSNFIPWFSSRSAEVTFSTSSCLSSCCFLSDWLVKGPILINKGSGSETDDAFLLGVVNHFMIVVSGKSFGSTIFRQQSSYLGIADLEKNEIIFLLLSKIGFSCVDVFENVIFDFKNVKNSTFTKTNKGILEMPAPCWQHWLKIDKLFE